MVDAKKNKNSKSKKIFLEVPSNGPMRGVFKFLGHCGYIEGTDLYVRWENINTALNRDVVEYVLLENPNPFDESKRYEARITGVLERSKIHFVGEVIYKEGGRTFVLLDNPKINRVATASETNYSVGEKVKMKITNFDLENLTGEIEKSLGNKNELNVEVISVLEDYGASYRFPEAVESAAARMNLDIEKHRKNPHRKDFTNIPLVTIDPEDSKDFDDAIAVIKDGNKYLLYVAISDVWTYIKDSPEIVEEAQSRSTSIYFLNSVVPMLPEKLSNNFCSLVPNEERCAVVFKVEISGDGQILWPSMEVTPALIRSHRRFTYGEVNDFFKGSNPLPDDLSEVKESLKNGLELYRILEKNRRRKGYISVDAPEIKMKLDENGEIESLYKYQRDESQIMIENFMILANEGIARLLQRERMPGIYRIHERPEVNKMLEFIQEARRLKFRINGDEFSAVTQSLISKWFEDNRKNPNIEIVKLLLLRSLQKARYSVGNLGHFGLNLKHYLHFTSPIRRYPDTIVHKMLWEYKFEGKPIPKTLENPIFKELHRICEHSTNREIIASEISREIENAKIIKYMGTQLNKVFRARVISSNKSGGFVKIEEILIEGFVKCKNPLPLGKYVLVKPIHGSKEFKFIKAL